MNSAITPSGIEAVGSLPWGTHFCQFYENRDDLASTLVPFFKAGLEQGERCLWVTSEPFEEEDARAALRASVARLGRLEKKGQIEIIDYRKWYQRAGVLTPAEAIAGWIRREEEARADGYAGLRLTGNTFWLQEHEWREFAEYERSVNEGFRDRRIVALCTYCLSRCGGSHVLDVVRNHAFAVARRFGAWDVVESAELAVTKDELRRLNAELEARVEARTAELTQAVAVKDALYREVHHRVRNNLQVINSLLSLRSRSVSDPEVRAVLAETADRIRTIGFVHDMLHGQADQVAIEVDPYLCTIATSLAQSHGMLDRVRISVSTKGTALPIQDATVVGMIATESLLNALKHAFPDDRPGKIDVSFGLDGDQYRLVVHDNGVGAARNGKNSGLAIAQALATQLSGRIDITGENGTRFELLFPARSAETAR